MWIAIRYGTWLLAGIWSGSAFFSPQSRMPASGICGNCIFEQHFNVFRESGAEEIHEKLKFHMLCGKLFTRLLTFPCGKHILFYMQCLNEYIMQNMMYEQIRPWFALQVCQISIVAPQAFALPLSIYLQEHS